MAKKTIKEAAKAVAETKKKQLEKSQEKAVTDQLVENYFKALDTGVRLGAHTSSFVLTLDSGAFNVIIKVAKV